VTPILASRFLRDLAGFATLLGVLLISATSPAAETTSTDAPKERYFYFGYDYGNQALYNPLYVFLNRGFDVLQVRVHNRDILHQDYELNGKNVLENLGHPWRSIREEGVWKFTREEILPLSYKGQTKRWVPNYSLHLLGGGMTYRQLWEWYDDYHVPLPWLFSATTTLATALVNETLENKGIVGRNTDAIADIYVFDLAGIALFSIDGVAKFFSKDVVIADWSLQPSFTYPGGDLHNQGNYYAAKWALPFYPKLSPLVYFGLGSLFGASYKLDGEYSISAAAGTKSSRLVGERDHSVRNNVVFAPSAALFLDRNNSLLAMLQIADVQDYFIQADIYPNAFFKTDPGFGLWAVMSQKADFVVGLTFTRALGFGLGAGKL
jgi:hypothetical protein